MLRSLPETVSGREHCQGRSNGTRRLTSFSAVWLWSSSEIRGPYPAQKALSLLCPACTFPAHSPPSTQISALLLDRLISSSHPRVYACDIPLPGVSFLVSSSHAWHPPIPQSNLNVTSSERLSLAICIPQDLTGIHGALIQMIRGG